MKMNKQNKYNYRIHAIIIIIIIIIIKVIYIYIYKLSPMKCLNSPTWVPNELSVLK